MYVCMYVCMYACMCTMRQVTTSQHLQGQMGKSQWLSSTGHKLCIYSARCAVQFLEGGLVTIQPTPWEQATPCEQRPSEHFAWILDPNICPRPCQKAIKKKITFEIDFRNVLGQFLNPTWPSGRPRKRWNLPPGGLPPPWTQLGPSWVDFGKKCNYKKKIV